MKVNAKKILLPRNYQMYLKGEYRITDDNLQYKIDAWILWEKSEQHPGADHLLNLLWNKDHYITSACKNYHQQSKTKNLSCKIRYKRALDKVNNPNHNNKCRLFMSILKDEGVTWTPSLNFSILKLITQTIKLQMT